MLFLVVIVWYLTLWLRGYVAASMSCVMPPVKRRWIFIIAHLPTMVQVAKTLYKFVWFVAGRNCDMRTCPNQDQFRRYVPGKRHCLYCAVLTILETFIFRHMSLSQQIITSLDSLLLLRLNLLHNIISKNRLSECRQGMSWPTSLHFQFLFVACTSVESETMLMLLIYRYGRFPVIYAVV